jgi:hypothetical protein
MNESQIDQAPKGGALHHLSDRYYKGGQFMPAPDALAKTKSKAIKAAAKHSWFSNPSYRQFNGKFSVFAETPEGVKFVCAADTEEQADATIEVLRGLIEVRLGGAKIDWS